MGRCTFYHWMQRIQDGFPCSAWEPDCGNRIISFLYPHDPEPSFPCAAWECCRDAPHPWVEVLGGPLYPLPLDATHP